MDACHLYCYSDLFKSLFPFPEFEDTLEPLQCLAYYRDSAKVCEDIFSHCFLSASQHASKALKEQNLLTQLHLNAHYYFHSEAQRKEQIKRLKSVFSLILKCEFFQDRLFFP